MKKHTLFVVLLFFCSTLALAPTPKQIIQKVIDNDRADSEKSQMKMTLINKRNQERVREVLAWSKKKDKNNDKKVIKFLSPADIRGSGLLTIEFSDREDDQWLYLPALKRDRRISSKKKEEKIDLILKKYQIHQGHPLYRELNDVLQNKNQINDNIHLKIKKK